MGVDVVSFSFMPVYTGDYLRDTRHLTPLKHGIYLLLLMNCWDQKGPLPRDEQECAGIANCRSADEVDALRYVLSRYFVLMEDGWYNKRMQIEVERAESISRARSDAGRAGYEARAKQLPGKSQAIASTPTPTPTTTPTPTVVTSVVLNPNVSTSDTSSRASARAKREKSRSQQNAETMDEITGKNRKRVRVIDGTVA
jgi:uncharacterized protein YdaU (DUF1376 family)